MKKTNFSIVYFLIIFFVLYYGFYFYIGLSTPGGKMYFPFLHTYLNIPYWLSIIVVKASVLLLKIAGYDVYQRSAVNITIRGSHGATIAWGCLGAGVMIFWFAFIMAHKAKGTYKLKWIVSGIAIIYLFNAIRIAAILLSYYYNWQYLQTFNAHSTFNNITYIIIIILALIFVYNYNRTEGRRINLSKE